MHWRKVVVLALLAGMLLTLFTSQAAAASDCDWAQYVADLSVPDGTSFTAGAAFTKSWRLTNIGTCTWTTGYKLVFHSGNQLGAPASVNLPAAVAPGQAVDVSVNMVAPAASGHYVGNWVLSNEAGVTFGIGPSAANPFWVDINVVDINSAIYDFVANAPYAEWKSASGILPYPGTSGDSRGYSYQLDAPHLEDDSVDTLPGLLAVPHNKYNGYIQGTYPEFLVQQGDRFQTLVNCEFGATGCYVTFSLNYMTSTGSVRSLWSFKEAYEGRFYRADIDLSRLAGQRVRFILSVSATGLASGDRAVWGAPRIIRTGTVQPPAPPPTLTPLPALTATPTPFSTPPPVSPPGCEKASFVADITVPDGTVFSPGAAFTKTWRLKNTGSCAWHPSFNFVFYSGSQFSAPTVIKLPRIIAPGQTVDLALNMVAPLVPGVYRGNWILQNASGAFFGIGKDAAMPVWVEIRVAGEASAASGYDFVQNACSAEWKVPVGISPCPGLYGDLAGFVLPVTAPTLEDGSIGTFGLLVAPQSKYNGTISGTYPVFTVQPGDRFQSTVGCEFGTSCYVTFRLDYISASGSISTFWSWREQNDGSFYNANVDLTPLAGRSVRFILTLSAAGSAANDRAIWGAPRIVRSGQPPLPITITPTYTPTVTSTATVTSTPTSTSTPTLTPTATASNWVTLLNTTYSFQLMYPPEAQKQNGSNDTYTRVDLPFQPGTNLREKYLEVVVAENVNPCQSPLATTSMLNTSENVTINGLTFLKQTGGDGGAGHLHEWVAYSIARGTSCISLDFMLHSLNAGNFETPPPEFDKAAESAVFQNIVSTFVWLTPPPPTSWLTYQNTKYGFQLMYPGEGQLTVQDDNRATVTLPFAAGTNLREKYLNIGVVENSTTCVTPLASSSILQTSEVVVINGLTFLKQTGEDRGVGHIHQWIGYSTGSGGICVSMDFILHSTNPDNYPTPPPVFDFAAESAVFEQIVRTFNWSAPPVTPESLLNDVVAGLNARDFVKLKSLMDQSLTIGYWQAEGNSYPPDGAIQELQNILGPALISDPNKDLNALLNGANPYSSMGINPETSKALYVSGWGLEGKDEALLYVTRRADGSLYWYGVLVAPGGFARFSATGTYAVTLIGQGGMLNIHSDAGEQFPVLGSFVNDATDIVRTERISQKVGDETWVEVRRLDGGTGWVNFKYLTEYVTRASFCADLRAQMTVDLLKHALIQSNGGLFASLVNAKHGVDIGFWRDAPPIHYTPGTAQSIFTDTTVHNWGTGPAAGPTPVSGTFAQIVQPDLLGVYASNYQLVCDDPSYASMFVNPWPYTNIHYYAVVQPPSQLVFDWKVWLIGIEYVDNNPYLYGTVHYVWEP